MGMANLLCSPPSIISQPIRKSPTESRFQGFGIMGELSPCYRPVIVLLSCSRYA
jgi:hypothetical protein